ncbi:unnamed protein product [Rhizophagus irregularis]|nr:unnamed protein product [Rhizophagus irregularis]
MSPRKLSIEICNTAINSWVQELEYVPREKTSQNVVNFWNEIEKKATKTILKKNRLGYINDVIEDSIRDAKVARVFLPGKLSSQQESQASAPESKISDLRTNQDHGDEGDNEIIKCQKRYMKPKKIVLIWNPIANRTDKLNEDTTPVVVSSLNESATFDRGKL